MSRPCRPGQWCAFYRARYLILRLPVDSCADRRVAPCQTAYPSASELFPSARTGCQCAGTAMGCGAAKSYSSLPDNVSEGGKGKERGDSIEIYIKEILNWDTGNLINISTHRILVPCACLCVDKTVQQPVDGLVIVEHLQEGDYPRQFCGFEHFSWRRHERRSITRISSYFFPSPTSPFTALESYL